ncbi:MAG: hypothetical protein L0228_02795 [Planctomycetes bacterium]|nr:hypothetical protein [Planctomycetota bacterium]
MTRLLAIGFLVLLGSMAADAQVIYNSSSTAGEGYQRGAAAVIQAQGQRNLSNSQAAINLTDARSSQIDNQVKSVNAFWEKKDIYAQRQQQEFAQIEAKRSFYMERHGLGYLTPEEFDRTTGTVTWLKVLEQKDYDPYRNKLDELCKKRAYAGALTGDEYMEATAASKDWRAMLARQKDVYPAPILSQMIRFVLKVTRELDDNLG